MEFVSVVNSTVPVKTEYDGDRNNHFAYEYTGALVCVERGIGVAPGSENGLQNEPVRKMKSTIKSKSS